MAYSLAFSHIGIFVTDIDRMVEFYTRFLGFVVSDRGVSSRGAEIVFMTRDPHEHHQLVMAAGRPADLAFNVINQLSFRVDSLATLREMYRGLRNEPVVDLGPVTHGNALSVYFHDPEKNRVELLIDTPWYVPQPHHLKVDLLLPDRELWAAIEKHVRSLPGFKTQAEWAAEIERKIALATERRQAALRQQELTTGKT
jgi:catechol 2,3-dioxygenase-like lactoylglutathione lyase family enzyme